MPKTVKNFPMSQVTTLQIGGPAKEFVVVKTEKELIQTIKSAKDRRQEFLVIGGGSNLLVSDEGVDKLVIKNEVSGITLHLRNRSHLRGDNQLDSRGHLGGGQNEGGELTVKSGTPLQNLVDFAIQNGLSGLQKLAGIPGTVGGAVYGNAAAYGQTISDHIVEIVILNSFQDLETLTREQCEFAYRDSGFKRNDFIILEIKFKRKTP
jgi:UDP-N-acetylmuramate dehydrogenase